MNTPNFNDAAVWATEESVPLLDEHTLTTKDGREQQVDTTVLEKIAANNNARIQNTGDWTPAVIGHTRDDDKETDQPPIAGYYGNFRVGPLLRPDGTPTGRDCLYADLKYRHKDRDLLNKHPRRSVELWVSRWEIEPVAHLGATTPERDLGLMHLPDNKAVPSEMANAGSTSLIPGTEHLLRFSRKTRAIPAHETPYRYEVDMGGCKPSDSKKPEKYDAADAVTDDKKPDAPTTSPGGDNTSEEMVAKVVASASFQKAIADAVTAAIEQALDGLDEGAEGGEGFGGDPDDLMQPEGGEAPQGEMPAGDGEGTGDDASAAPPPAKGKKGPPAADTDSPAEEARVDNEPPPVKLSATSASPSYGFPSPTSNSLPTPAKVHMSRQDAAVPAVQPAAAPKTDASDLVVKLQRRVAELEDKDAASEARSAVAALKAEGVDFGTQEEEADDVNRLKFLYQRNKEAFDADIKRIRAKYKRQERKIDEPTDVLKYSRTGEAPPMSQSEVAARAEAVARYMRTKNLSYEDAVAQAANVTTKTK